MKNETEIEQKLTSLNKVSLPESEKSAIKASLMKQAATTLPTYSPSTPIVSPFNVWFVRGTVSFASFLLIFVGTAYASKDSLPGDPLYAMKVNVLEEAISLTKIERLEHTNYEIIRMENRLAELQELSRDTKLVNSDDLNAFAEQIDEHINDISETFDEIDNDISHLEKINALSKLSSIVKAQKRVIKDNTEFESAGDDIDDAGDETSDLLGENIDNFTNEENIDVVAKYLSEEVAEMKTKVEATSTTAKQRESYKKNLLDLEEAINSRDLPEAIITILEAEQEEEVADYLDEETN